MRSFLFTTMCFHFLVSSSLAQNSSQVSGLVKGASENTTFLSGATVTLLRVKDTVAVKFAVSGKDGAYLFEKVPNGRYRVAVSSVSYRKNVSAAFEITAQDQSVQVPVIILVFPA